MSKFMRSRHLIVRSHDIRDPMGPATIVDIRPVRLITGNISPESFKIQLEDEAALGRLAEMPNHDPRMHRLRMYALWTVDREQDLERFKIGDVVRISQRGMASVALVSEL